MKSTVTSTSNTIPVGALASTGRLSAGLGPVVLGLSSGSDASGLSFQDTTRDPCRHSWRSVRKRHLPSRLACLPLVDDADWRNPRHNRATTEIRHTYWELAVLMAAKLLGLTLATTIAVAACSTKIGTESDPDQTPSVAQVSTEQSDRIEAQMASLRENLGNIPVGTEPLRDVEGSKITKLTPYPGLLAGARDARGFSGYVSSSPDDDLASGDIALAGSQTKTFTAAAILQLDQEGLLSIKDTLADPKWAKTLRWPNGKNITIEMVLSHTAGIPDFTATKGFQKTVANAASPSPNDLLDLVRNEPALFPPGETWAYSNTDYIIAGLIIEQVTGNSYASELRSRFLDPLELTQTYLFGDPKTDPTMIGYYLKCLDAQESTGSGNGEKPECKSGVGAWSPVTAPYTNSWPIIWAAGSIASSTTDLTKWITELVSTDNVLDAEHREMMQKPVPQSKSAIKQQHPQWAKFWTGYGLGMATFEYDIGTGFGHPGNIEGYASISLYFPGDDNSFAMTLIASQTHADVAAEGGNDMATVIKQNRG